MKFRPLFSFFLLSCLALSVHAQSPSTAVRKDPASGELTESISVGSGKTLQIKAGAVLDLSAAQVSGLAGLLHPEAQTWLAAVSAAGGTVRVADAGAVSTFIEKLYISGLRSKIYRANPFAGENIQAALVPVLRGPTLGAALGYEQDQNNGPFGSGAYSRGGGLAGNGTAFLSTGLPLSALPGPYNRHVAAFHLSLPSTSFMQSIGMARDGNDSMFAVGSGDSSTSFWTYAYSDAGGAALTVISPARLRLGIASLRSSTETAFSMGVGSETTGTPGASMALASDRFVAVFGTLVGPTNAYYVTDARLGGYSIGAALSSSEQVAYIAIWEELQASFGR